MIKNDVIHIKVVKRRNKGDPLEFSRKPHRIYCLFSQQDMDYHVDGNKVIYMWTICSKYDRPKSVLLERLKQKA